MTARCLTGNPDRCQRAAALSTRPGAGDPKMRHAFEARDLAADRLGREQHRQEERERDVMRLAAQRSRELSRMT